MITIHHLGVSQSDRIVWLMEELHLPYRLKWHNRTESGLAPDEYLALHPAATAPVIEDEGTVLTESAVGHLQKLDVKIGVKLDTFESLLPSP